MLVTPLFSLEFASVSPINSRSRMFQRRQLLPLENHLLWKIETGFVRTLTSDEDGTLTTLGFWKSGDFVGLPLTDIRPYFVECLTPVQAVQLFPKISEVQDEKISQMQIFQAQQAQALLRIAHSKRVELRLLKLLIWLSKLLGEKVEKDYFVPIYLTHQDIADTVGTTRVTVTRLLNELQRNGILREANKGYFLREEESG